MSREALKSIQSSQLQSRRVRDINKSKIIDKENVIQNDKNWQILKGAIPKVPIAKCNLKKPSYSNVFDANIPTSSLSMQCSKDIQETKRHSRTKSDDTYCKAYRETQFSIYNENTENISKIATENGEYDNQSLYKRSRAFFLQKSQNSSRYNTEINSPLAKRVVVKQESIEAFRKAKEVFIIYDEKEKIRKQLDSMLDNSKLHNKNISKLECHRIGELKVLNSKLNQDITPYDTNNILPPQEMIKVVHKHKKRENILHPNVILPTWNFDNFNDIYYVKDITNFYIKKEKSRRQFISRFRRQNINLEQRKILINHLMKIHKDYNYSSFIAYQAARIMHDMFDAKRISIKELQLVELSSLWIALKNNILGYSLPDASRIISFSDGAYTKEDLHKCEKNILQILNFNVSYADPFSVFFYSIISHDNFIFMPKNSNIIYYSGNYMLDVALFDESLMDLSPVLLGCAAAEMSLVINLAPEEAFTDPEHNHWRSDCAKANFTSAEILRVQSLILRLIIKSSYTINPEHVVFKKYKRSRYGRVSYSLILNISKLSSSPKNES
ncbi:hypothetical protein PV327_002882 [Microctonus hyperodae]|uniref:Cyclin N-terminal domain-containing protein n=1 Tax=Microctonus hyperodae TaxID=165561 RepID=A0AA39KPU7_MICHY|nr:hypothetical protein PV327_002882 [Microctonus hyperodae]